MIRGVVFKNRLELAPVSSNLASLQGRVTTEFIKLFRSVAQGGAAIITVGNATIDISESCDEERQLDLGRDDCILPLTRFGEMCHGYGAVASIEINHSGAESNVDKTRKGPFSASSIVTSNEMERANVCARKPIATVEMDHDKIKQTIESYAAAAYRCKRAGFKMCMVHGGHGNLIAQFASPLYNKRIDEYGGSLENRARFSGEVLDAVRDLCGADFVIEYRISADEIHPEGMHFDETIKFIELIHRKIDILHVSAGLHGELQYRRYWWQNYLMERSYNVQYAADIKKAFPKLLVCTVGSIMNIDQAETILVAGQADFVAMCRPLLADPEMPRKYALGKQGDHRPCIRCQYCGLRLMVPAVINCAVNPFLGNETEFPEGKVKKSNVRKRVAVIGGGPAGLQALQTLCERGHDVTLYEMSDHLGGNIIYGSALPFKRDIRDYLEYLVRQSGKAHARILLNTEATKDMLNTEGYDAIIIAVGSKPLVPQVPGIDKPHVHWAPEVELYKLSVGNKTVIVGAGAVGMECAIGLKKAGKDVTVVEMAPDMSNLSASAGRVSVELIRLSREYDIPIYLNTKLEEVTNSTVLCRDKQTSEKTMFPADTMLFAIGMSSRHAVADSMRHCAPETEVYVVGDALEVGTVATAVRSAFRAAACI